MEKIIITKNEQNQTLIKFLNKYLPKASNSLLYKWIRTKKVKVNKKRAEPSLCLYENDVVNIYIYDEVLNDFKKDKKEFKSKISLDIAFENKDIIILDKPQNVLVHSASKEDYGKNVVDFMVDLLISRGEYNPRLEINFRPSIVNRIDRNTFGLVVGAKNRRSLLILNQNKNLIHKYYLAIVEGKISEKIDIENKLEKDNKNHVKVSKDGKESHTIVYPLKYTDKVSLVEIELLTGRTHQIRASLANIGHPIIGDRRYGNKKFNNKKFKDQQLVAYKIVFDKDIGLKSLKELKVVSKYKDYIEKLYYEIEGDYEN